MASNPIQIPAAVNQGAAAVLAAAVLAQLLLLPLLLRESLWWALAAMPVATATPSLWALIHEAIHGSLHPDRRRNRILGRALGVLFGAPFGVLRFGHLTHHAIYALPEDQAPARHFRIPAAISVPVYYLRILGGVFLVEVAAGLAMLLPRRLLEALVRRLSSAHAARGLDLRGRAQRMLLAGPELGRLRTDAVLIAALHGVSFWLYGGHAWVLLAALAARAALVSFHDNLYHHRRPGEPRLTRNLDLPGWASAAILHANLHAVHHRRPGLPWRALPAVVPSGARADSVGFGRACLNQVLFPAR